LELKVAEDVPEDLHALDGQGEASTSFRTHDKIVVGPLGDGQVADFEGDGIGTLAVTLLQREGTTAARCRHGQRLHELLLHDDRVLITALEKEVCELADLVHGKGKALGGRGRGNLLLQRAFLGLLALDADVAKTSGEGDTAFGSIRVGAGRVQDQVAGQVEDLRGPLAGNRRE